MIENMQSNVRTCLQLRDFYTPRAKLFWKQFCMNCFERSFVNFLRCEKMTLSYAAPNKFLDSISKRLHRINLLWRFPLPFTRCGCRDDYIVLRYPWVGGQYCRAGSYLGSRDRSDIMQTISSKRGQKLILNRIRNLSQVDLKHIPHNNPNHWSLSVVSTEFPPLPRRHLSETTY